MNKISFQVPFIIFTQNVLFFSGNVIFDVFPIKKGKSYFYEQLIFFLKNKTLT